MTIKEDIRYLCSIHYFTDCGTRDENGKNINTRITLSKVRENTSTASLDGNDRRKQVCFKHMLLTLIQTVMMKANKLRKINWMVETTRIGYLISRLALC